MMDRNQLRQDAFHRGRIAYADLMSVWEDLKTKSPVRASDCAEFLAAARRWREACREFIAIFLDNTNLSEPTIEFSGTRR
jgi:hypothetical protein